MEFAQEGKNLCFVISDKKKKDLFVHIFNLLKCSSSHINATIERTNFHIQGMDKSHVCLFDLNLNATWFDYYNCTSDINICYDSNIFYSIISTKCEEQSIIIYLDEAKNDELFIEFKNSETSKKSDYNKFFKLPLLEYDYDQMKLFDVDYDAEFTLPSKKVTDMLSQLNNFGDDLNIKCLDDCVDFKASGNSVEMRVNINIDDISSYAIVENEVIELTYSLAYISKMCISNKLTNEIEFSLSNDSPMKINYNLDVDSSLKFYIAPKIIDD